MTTDSYVQVIGLVKGDERYIVFFDEHTPQYAYRQFGQWASNPELSFTWYDAAVMVARVRRELKGAQT